MTYSPEGSFDVRPGLITREADPSSPGNSEISEGTRESHVLSGPTTLRTYVSTRGPTLRTETFTLTGWPGAAVTNDWLTETYGRGSTERSMTSVVTPADDESSVGGRTCKADAAVDLLLDSRRRSERMPSFMYSTQRRYWSSPDSGVGGEGISCDMCGYPLVFVGGRAVSMTDSSGKARRPSFIHSRRAPRTA